MATLETKNKELVRNAIENVWDAREISAFEEYYADDFVSRNPLAGEGDLDSVKQVFETMLEAFPDMRWSVEDLVAEGDKVTLRERMQGTHQGEFMGVEPTGNEVTFEATIIARIEDDTIVEDWVHGDFLGLMQQVGVIPSLEQGGE